jgi:hypothetical protein
MQARRFAVKNLFHVAIGAACLSVVHAQSEQYGSQPVVPDIPEKESPFFVLNDEPMNPAQRADKQLTGPETDFPRNKGADQSAGEMFTHFFTDMFTSIHFGGKVIGPTGSKLTVEPTKFSVEERHDLTVTFVVDNNTKKLVKLDFPTSQRIEILVRDSTGKILERWSDDHVFQDVSGVVMIDPHEYVQYQETISTRDMQGGKTYTIEVSLANNPEYTKAVAVTPTKKAAEPLPNPVLQQAAQSTPPQG